MRYILFKCDYLQTEEYFDKSRYVVNFYIIQHHVHCTINESYMNSVIWLHYMYLIVLMCNNYYSLWFNRRVTYSWNSWYCIQDLRRNKRMDVLNYGIMEVSSQHTSVIYLSYYTMFPATCFLMSAIVWTWPALGLSKLCSVFYLLFFWALPQHLSYYSCRFTIISSNINLQLTICIYNFKEQCITTV